MGVLRSESRAIHRSASSLRAGASIASSFGSSRAGSAARTLAGPSGRGPRGPSARSASPSARAVSGFLASVMGAAQAGARPLRVVGAASARHSLPRGGNVAAPGVISWHNYVFSRTAGTARC
jgi:hypothetical protein